MGLNYQDVIRDVHDPSTHTLKTSGSASSSGNVTLAPSPNFIGIVTVANSQANSGNVTLNPSPNFIGIVTIANPGATGNVTLDPGSRVGVLGNITLSDSKSFIGLVTVKASLLDTYASLATFTISLASIASSTAGVGRQSTMVDNTSTKYTSANVYLRLTTGGISSTPNSLIYAYLLRGDNNSVTDDGAGASDAALTVINAPLLGSILVTASNASTNYYGSFNTSFLGSLGPKWGIAVVNSLGAPLSGTEGNMLKNWIGVNSQLT